VEGESAFLLVDVNVDVNDVVNDDVNDVDASIEL